MIEPRWCPAEWLCVTDSRLDSRHADSDAALNTLRGERYDAGAVSEHRCVSDRVHELGKLTPGTELTQSLRAAILATYGPSTTVHFRRFASRKTVYAPFKPSLERVRDAWRHDLSVRAREYDHLIVLRPDASLAAPEGCCRCINGVGASKSGVISGLELQTRRRGEFRVLPHFPSTYAARASRALAMARENLRSARDLVPREVWEEINGLHLFIADEGQHIERRLARSRVMERVVHSARQIAGTIESGMSRDAAYDMLTLGLSLERADMTTRIIDVRSSDLLVDENSDLRPYQTVQWISVLKSLSAFQMYRRHVRVRVTGPGVVRFLLADTAFPRSVRFCLQRASQRLSRLPAPGRCSASIDAAMHVLGDADLSTLKGHRLSEFLDRMQIELNGINNAIQDRYFQH